MRRKISAYIGLIVLIFLCTSGLIEPITKVFIWLITIDSTSPDISIFGQLVAKYGTWIITYSLVGVLFNALGWFNSTAMKIVYFIFSTIISFLLSWGIMILEKYLLVITIVIGILLIIGLGILITIFIYNKKKKPSVLLQAYCLQRRKTKDVLAVPLWFMIEIIRSTRYGMLLRYLSHCNGWAPSASTFPKNFGQPLQGQFPALLPLFHISQQLSELRMNRYYSSSTLFLFIFVQNTMFS